MTDRSPNAHRKPRHERPFHVLRHRDYRLIWSADVLSMMGSQIQRVAVAWQVFELTHDPFQLGLLGLVRFIPLVLFGLAGGVLADRYDRRAMLILSQLALMATSAALAGLTLADRITMPWIYALTALAALFGAVSAPTRLALIPALVPEAAMPAAMTMSVLATEAAGTVGPALGGTLVASAGIGVSYAVNAATFGAVAIAAMALRARPARTAPIISGREAAIEGLRFLRASPVLLGTMGLDFLANFFGASTTLMPIFASEILGGGPQTLGWLLTAPAIGSVAGATILASTRPLSRPGVGILAAVIVYGLSLTAFALSRDFVLSLALLAASGAADSVSVAQRHALRNLVTPDRLRGRVAAAHGTFAGGGPQLGEFEAGIVASMTSAPLAVVIGGVGTVVAALVVNRRVPGIARLRWETSHHATSVAEARQSENRGAVHIDESGTGSI